jgi:pyruvate formate lyase activating enzyme
MLTGTILNLQRTSVHDGPGIRTTVFLKGCPLRCAWCHNPESQSLAPECFTVETRCLGCGACREACPRGAAGPCTACGACAEACPTGARTLAGRAWAPSDLVRELLRDRVFFEESGGGVTLGGGEPLAQPDFTREVLRLLRERGTHTALDTCGAVPWGHLEAAAGLADLVLYDLKLMDEARHRQWTGAALAPILANLQALCRIHPEVWIRIPVIPGVNDDVENLEAAARFVAELPGARRVHLLPFHRTGLVKFQRMGRTSPLETTQPPTPGEMEAHAAPFRHHGLDTHLGGQP